MKITSFNRNNCGDVRRVLEQALQDAGIEGVIITTRGGTYSNESFNFKVVVQTTAVGADGNTIGSSLKHAMQMHNLSRTVADDGSILIDYHPRNRKFPFIVEAGGKRWKYTEFQAKQAFT